MTSSSNSSKTSGVFYWRGYFRKLYKTSVLKYILEFKGASGVLSSFGIQNLCKTSPFDTKLIRKPTNQWEFCFWGYSSKLLMPSGFEYILIFGGASCLALALKILITYQTKMTEPITEPKISCNFFWIGYFYFFVFLLLIEFLRLHSHKKLFTSPETIFVL
jgi:hypothetical protein